MKNTQKYIWGIVSGALLCLSYPPYPFFIFAFIGMVPLLMLIEKNVVEGRPQKIFLPIYLAFFVYHAGTNWWISSWQSEADPYLLVSGILVAFVHPFFFLVPFWVYKYFREKLSKNEAQFLFPLIWLSFEWIHSLGDLAYPWLSLGYTQIYNIYFVQFADLFGIWGVSLIIAIVNVLVFRCIDLIKLDLTQKWNVSSIIKNKFFIKYGLIIIAIFLPLYIYGIIRINHFTDEKLLAKADKVKVGLIQANINPWRKWDTSPLRQIDLHFKLQDSLINAYGKLDVILWSETAITYIDEIINNQHRLDFLQTWVNYRKTSILTGFSDIQFLKPTDNLPKTAKIWYDSSKYYVSYNSAIIINPSDTPKTNIQVYHKMKLTPFGEQLPYNEYIGFAMKWLEWGVGISSWTKGKEQKNLILKNKSDEVKIAPIICIESVFPEFVSNFTKLGADILSIITNDGWYDGTFGPEQHYLIACMRAIENRRYLVRCANTGVTGFITPTGKTLKRAPTMTRIAIAEEIPIITETPLFVSIGDRLPSLASLTVLFAFGYKFFRWRRRK